jgi:hypothetical protein
LTAWPRRMSTFGGKKMSSTLGYNMKNIFITFLNNLMT